MRTRGELSLTLSVLALVLMTVGSIMGISIARNRVTTDSNASSPEPVTSSRWFTSNPGIACNAWLTCTSSGPEIMTVYLTQNGNEFRLPGSDRNGQDYYNTVMSSCQGGDEMISVQYNPKALSKMSATFIKSYKVDDNSVVLSINTGGGAKTKFFVYDIPEGFNRNAPANLQVRFRAKTAGQYTGIDQTTTIKGCEADGEPVIETTPDVPNNDPSIFTIEFEKPTNIGARFGDAKTFAYEVSACHGDSNTCVVVYTGETAISAAEGTTITIPSNQLRGKAIKIVYSYKNAQGEKLAENYIARHKPYFQMTFNHGPNFLDDTCAYLPQTSGQFECVIDFGNGTQITLKVALTTDIQLNMLGTLPSDVVLKSLVINTCDLDGNRCYNASFTDFRPSETIVSFPTSDNTQMIKFIVETSSGPIALPIKYLTQSHTARIKLDCQQGPIFFTCIDYQQDRTMINRHSYFITPRKFELNLSNLKNAPPQPSTAPSNQPSPIPSPSVEPSSTPEPNPSPVVPSAPVPSGPPEIPVDFEFKIDMSPESIDWAKEGIRQVYIIVQACDSDDKYEQCLSSYKEIYKHTYTTQEASYIKEEIPLQMTKGKKKFNIGMRYLHENGDYINSSYYAPHIPVIEFRRYDDKPEYMKNCTVQALELFCGIEVYDTHNNKWNSNIVVEITPVGSFFFSKAHASLLPPGLVNKDDKIQVTSRVYNDKTEGQPLYQSPPVIITHEALVTGGMSRLYFPIIRYAKEGELLTYEVDVEYILGLITPKTPNIDWFTPDENFFDCSTHVISTPLDSQTHRLSCKIKPNTSFEKYIEINHYGMNILVNKFVVEDGFVSEYNPKGSAQFAQLFKELRSSDLNGDKVVSILDLTAVFDAYYATGNFPEDINNDNVVNIQDAMIVVSHLSESAP